MATKKKAAAIPECPYGARCYRKNPDHLAEFSHPKKAKGEDSTDSAADSASPSTSKIDDGGLPPCKYGASCYRKNLMHFAEYSHPTAVTDKVTASDDSGHDTDVLSDTDSGDDKKPSTSKKKKKSVKSEDILKRGMSLVKSYSKMTEAERKELIKKAFEAKAKLQKELKETKAEVKKKDQELDKLTKEVASGLLLMDGEKEALEGKTTVYFDLFAERAYKEGSAAQMHFRLAESQFYRLLSGSAGYRITKVEYVVNPKLCKGFRECRDALKKLRGEEFSYPVLAFHGTKQEYITPICEAGFKVPGAGHKHRTDTGWYGKGVYFSEYPTYSMGYIQGATKLLLSQVLPGKVFQCTKLIHGAALQKGYDSHTSPDSHELVIFNTYHILPQYLVHYTTAAGGEFKYTAPPTPATAKAAGKKGAKAAADDKLDVQNMDSTVVNSKYWEALGKPGSKAMSGHMAQFTGTFPGTQKEMQDLVKKHGGTIGSKAVFNLLVASPMEYNLNTNKVYQAEKKGVDIVHEMYMYDTIIKKKKQDIEKYKFS